MNKKGVGKWVVFNILGGLAFLCCQALEWKHIITGDHEVLVNGAVQHWGTTVSHNPFGPKVEFNGKEIGTPGPIAFGGYFFGITGFTGFHGFSGVGINGIMLLKTRRGNFPGRDM